MSILLKAIYRFNTIPINISVALFFAYTGKIILKFIWKLKGFWLAKTIFEGKNKIRGLTFSLLQNILLSYSNQNSMGLAKTGQWNRTERAAIKLTYMVKWPIKMWRPLNSEKTVSSTNGAGKIGYTHAKKKRKWTLTFIIYINELKMY